MLEAARRTLGEEHPVTLTNKNNLASTYSETRQFDKAIPLKEETLKLMESKLGPQDPRTLTTKGSLAATLREAGQLDRAVALFDETLEAQEQTLGRKHVQTVATMYQLGLAHMYREEFAKAEPLLRECLTASEVAQPDLWTMFNRKSLLGGALLGQARELQSADAAAAKKLLAEAEPLLLAGYEGMKAREEKIPVPGKIRLREAIQRLVEFYTELKQPVEAAKWQLVLDERNARVESAPESP